MTEKGLEQVPTVRMREINHQAEGTALRKAVEALSGKYDCIKKGSPLIHIEENIAEIPLKNHELTLSSVIIATMM